MIRVRSLAKVVRTLQKGGQPELAPYAICAHTAQKVTALSGLNHHFAPEVFEDLLVCALRGAND